MNITSENQMLGYAAASEHKTNHVLHLLLTIATLGAWSWIWLIVASSNITKRNKIKKKSWLPTETNAPKILLWINAIFWAIFIYALVSSSKASAAEDIGISNRLSICIDNAEGVTANMLDCISAETKFQDTRLNNAYKVVLSTLTKERNKRFKESQRAWIKFRDANCNFYADPDGGTAASMDTGDCFMTATAKRAKELEDLKDMIEASK